MSWSKSLQYIFCTPPPSCHPCHGENFHQSVCSTYLNMHAIHRAKARSFKCAPIRVIAMMRNTCFWMVAHQSNNRAGVAVNHVANTMTPHATASTLDLLFVTIVNWWIPFATDTFDRDSLSTGNCPVLSTVASAVQEKRRLTFSVLSACW